MGPREPTPKLPLEKYGAVFDAHAHTCFDLHDGLITPRELVECTVRRGFNFVCALAHDTTMGSRRVERLASESGLPCVVGIEVSTTLNHVLGYGVNEWPWRRDSLNPGEAIDQLRAQGCAVFLAHPGLKGRGGRWTPEIGRRLDVDGVEWMNGSNYLVNRLTRKWYGNLVPPGRRIAGTDAHCPSSFGYAFTQVAVNGEDPDDLVAAMRRGKCRPGGSCVPFHRFAKDQLRMLAWNKVIRRFRVLGRWIAPVGDYPWSMVPEDPVPLDEWKRELAGKRLPEPWFHD
ncbi:MAG: CehA/McbA family metallohydrolase [Promethearchaeota archaeon]